MRDFFTAIAAADSLVDFKMGNSQGPFEKKKRERGGKKDRSGTFKDANEVDWKKKMNGGDFKNSDNNQKKKSFDSGCFACSSPHRARDCPKWEKLTALVAESGDNNDDDYPTRVNPLQLLNAMSLRKIQQARKGLIFV